ncbi:MAG: hypothetical protein KAT68_06880 [Bacteroidales bacterium]|nr:hypothetical protein [Bacteroidales bacterium]
MFTFLFIMGIVSYLLIMFSFITGTKIIKVKNKVHKTIGIIGFSSASIHGLIMLYFNLF